MKISELIKVLQTEIDINGDIEFSITVFEDGFESDFNTLRAFDYERSDGEEIVLVKFIPERL